jgi:hypothetical protein
MTAWLSKSEKQIDIIIDQWEKSVREIRNFI